MTDITIPPEAVEAAKREAAAAIYRLIEPDTRAHELTEDEVAKIATAALRAGLEAWPGMVTNYSWDASRGRIILPLPQENT